MVVMDVQLCDYTKSYWIVHFKWEIVQYVEYISIKLLKKWKFSLGKSEMGSRNEAKAAIFPISLV